MDGGGKGAKGMIQNRILHYSSIDHSASLLFQHKVPRRNAGLTAKTSLVLRADYITFC